MRRDQQTGIPNDEPRHTRGDPAEALDLARYAARRMNDYDHARHADEDHVYEPINVYNAHGSPEGEEARNRSPAFKAGGRKKRRIGGKSQGEIAMRRADRQRRTAGGYAGPPRSPYSTAHHLQEQVGSSGHEGSGDV